MHLNNFINKEISILYSVNLHYFGINLFTAHYIYGNMIELANKCQFYTFFILKASRENMFIHIQI